MNILSKPTHLSFHPFLRVSIFIFALFISLFEGAYAQQNQHTGNDAAHKGEHQAGQENHAAMDKHGMKNRPDVPEMPSLGKMFEVQNQILAQRLELSDEQLVQITEKQAVLIEKIESEVGQKREEIDQKRSEMMMRRDAMRKVHKENPEARPSQEVREAMQKAMREEQQELRERMERMNKNRHERVESEYLLILHEILSDEQYQTYLEQRDEIRREIRSQLRQ